MWMSKNTAAAEVAQPGATKGAQDDQRLGTDNGVEPSAVTTSAPTQCFRKVRTAKLK